MISSGYAEEVFFSNFFVFFPSRLLFYVFLFKRPALLFLGFLGRVRMVFMIREKCVDVEEVMPGLFFAWLNEGLGCPVGEEQ